MSEIFPPPWKKKKNKSKYGFLKQLNASLYYEYRTIKSDFH